MYVVLILIGRGAHFIRWIRIYHALDKVIQFEQAGRVRLIDGNYQRLRFSLSGVTTTM